MTKISCTNNYKSNYSAVPARIPAHTNSISASAVPARSSFAEYSSENLKSYLPSFCSLKTNSTFPSEAKQIKTIKKKLDDETQQIFSKLEEKGILKDTSFNSDNPISSGVGL